MERRRQRDSCTAAATPATLPNNPRATSNRMRHLYSSTYSIVRWVVVVGVASLSLSLSLLPLLFSFPLLSSFAFALAFWSVNSDHYSHRGDKSRPTTPTPHEWRRHRRKMVRDCIEVGVRFVWNRRNTAARTSAIEGRGLSVPGGDVCARVWRAYSTHLSKRMIPSSTTTAIRNC